MVRRNVKDLQMTVIAALGGIHGGAKPVIFI
jgi:hypothetical protein